MDLERRRLRVYVAGPISKGDVFENVTRAIRVGKQMVKDGLAPYVPHFDSYMFPGSDISWNAFLEWDMEWLAECEAVYRLSGESAGAAVECEKARGLGIPIFYQLDANLHGEEDPGYRALLRHAAGLGLTGVRE